MWFRAEAFPTFEPQFSSLHSNSSDYVIHNLLVCLRASPRFKSHHPPICNSCTHCWGREYSAWKAGLEELSFLVPGPVVPPSSPCRPGTT